MSEELRSLLRGFELREPPDLPTLTQLIDKVGIALPEDYLALLATSDGAAGDVGAVWLELWPVVRVLDALEEPPVYEGVVLFAGNGANAVYGFDRFRDGQIVEGDLIGL